MGLTHVTVTMRSLRYSEPPYEAEFLVDTEASDSLVPGAALREAGIRPVSKMSYQLADGSIKE